MNNTKANLVTLYKFRGKEYLVHLSQAKHQLDNITIKVTDKQTSEEWLGSYDASYIENLTHKTGNYKRFDTFVSMVKSGLLSTSHCVTLDLLTFDDLEMLRNRLPQSRAFVPPHSSQLLTPHSSNRRYLIVTYTVEFDRIHYPLALEYCGLPDPRILQDTIQRLEKQIVDLQHQLNGCNWLDVENQINSLQKKVVDVSTENLMLKEQLKKSTIIPQNKKLNKDMDILFKTISSLENKLKVEYENTEKLRKINCELSFQLGESQKTEKLLRAQINLLNSEHPTTNKRFMKKNYLSNMNKSLDNCGGKPPRRCGAAGRKTYSARSSLNVNSYSSSEGSLDGSGVRKPRKTFKPIHVNNRPCVISGQSPRLRASSPSIFDLSHNSGFSRCACEMCLQSKFLKREDQSGSIGRHEETGLGKAKLMKRIQSLEKLISNLVMN